MIFPKQSFSEIELTKQMTEQEDTNILDRIVFDENNQERKSWSCLGQTCSRSLSVFLFHLFVILLIIFGCFWRIHLSKTCDESTVWVGYLCSVAGYILPPPRSWTSFFLQKIEYLFHWLVPPKLKNRSLLTIGWKLEHSHLSLTKFFTFINIPNIFKMLCKKKLDILSLRKEWILNLLIR